MCCLPLLVVVRVGVSRETWRVAVGVGKQGGMFHVKHGRIVEA